MNASHSAKRRKKDRGQAPACREIREYTVFFLRKKFRQRRKGIFGVTHTYVRTNVTVSPENLAQKHERILGTIASAKAGRRFRSFRKKSFGIAEKKASKVIPGDVCTRHTVSRISTKMLAHASHFRDVIALIGRRCTHLLKEMHVLFSKKNYQTIL